jgi:hypothetical protein
VVLDNGTFSVATTNIDDVDLGSTPGFLSDRQQDQERGQRIRAARLANESRIKEQAKIQPQQQNETVPKKHYHQPMGGTFQTK